MKRREMLKLSGAAIGLSMFPLGWTRAEEGKKEKVLYYTQSAGFRHGPVTRKNGELAFSEKVMVEVGKEHGVEVVCSQDGGVFDGDLDQYAAIAFYTSGDLTTAEEKPMSKEGKKKLLDWISAGGGFVGFHSATDSFRMPNDKEKKDPYIEMLGGEFITHGAQQKAKMKVASPKFPEVENLGDGFDMMEEWYAMYKFGKDLHVVLVQETAGMTGDMYQRPPFPATWAKMFGKGRVFYTSMGHREDVWTNKEHFQTVVLGGFSWVMKHVDADVTPNVEQVTPGANKLTK